MFLSWFGWHFAKNGWLLPIEAKPHGAKEFVVLPGKTEHSKHRPTRVAGNNSRVRRNLVNLVNESRGSDSGVTYPCLSDQNRLLVFPQFNITRQE